MTRITETIGRQALIATASNYRSVSEAIMELVDNPFDYRWGRHLSIDIEVDRTGDFVRVTDKGGEGMNDETLRDWIQWGEGHAHRDQDIGQYHVGGKSAAIYLAESLEVVCRKAGSEDIWRFHDPHWGSRTTPLTAEVQPMSSVPRSLTKLPSAPNTGFVQITLRQLKAHRYEVAILKGRLADTYRSLIQDSQCTIRVNGDQLTVEEMPWSSSIDRANFGPRKLDNGIRIDGVIGGIDRDRLPTGRGYRFQHGIRTEYNGRKITDGEEFGHNLSGRGSLMRLYGDVRIRGGDLRPNQLKNGWPFDSDDWQVLEVAMHDLMVPVVQQLNDAADAKPVTPQERKRANNARRRVERAFKRLRQLKSLVDRGRIPDSVGPGGRLPPSTSLQPREQSDSTRNRGEISNRTPPPSNSVGQLLRRLGGLPQVRLDGLGDQSPRTAWRQEDNNRLVVINTDYPLYQSLGTNEDYVFESLIAHVLHDDDEMSPEDIQRLFDQIVWLDRNAEAESEDTSNDDTV